MSNTISGEYLAFLVLGTTSDKYQKYLHSELDYASVNHCKRIRSSLFNKQSKNMNNSTMSSTSGQDHVFPSIFIIIWLSNLLTMTSVPGEGYSRNVSCALD